MSDSMSDQAGFKDHFSSTAEAYGQFRPSYPAALFESLAALAPGRDLAWDCGCGNGQASLGLAAHFAAVHASDPSERQIAEAAPHPRVRYTVGRAEQSGLAAASVDLILAAQAAHWFDHAAFHAEVRRVAKPGALLALVSYGLLEIAPEIDALLHRFHNETLGPYWPAERWLVVGGYRDLPFPFPEIAPPRHEMAVDWSLAHLIGYIGTWSGLGACREQTGEDPLPAIGEALAAAWGAPERVRAVRWPLSLRLGRVRSAAAEGLTEVS